MYTVIWRSFLGIDTVETYDSLEEAHEAVMEYLDYDARFDLDCEQVEVRQNGENGKLVFGYRLEEVGIEDERVAWRRFGQKRIRLT